MISFKEFCLLKENPDTVSRNLPDGTSISLHMEDNNSYSFGFFNPPSNIDVGELRGKLVMENEGMQGMRKTHAYTLSEFLQDNDVSPNVIKSIRHMDARKLMKPAGRIWLGVSTNSNNVHIISFWCSNYDVKLEHIKQVLNWFLLDQEDYNKIYLEFVGDKTIPFTALTEFKETSKPQKISKEQQAEIQRQESEKHITGVGKNPDFGSKKQNLEAQKAGEKSYAEYKKKLDPYGYRGESYQP